MQEQEEDEEEDGETVDALEKLTGVDTALCAAADDDHSTPDELNTTKTSINVEEQLKCLRAGNITQQLSK